MLSRTEALESVKAHLATRSEAGDLLVLEDDTLEYEFGWVFFYDSATYIRTGKIQYALAGNAPIIVARSNAELFETATAEPVAAYVEAFARSGDPHRRASD
jgi:hypothetical protein